MAKTQQDFTKRIEFSRGLEGVVAKETMIDHVDGERGRLIYRGYSSHDIAEQSNYDELVYLLLNGRLPKTDELREVKEKLAGYREVPRTVIEVLKLLPRDVTPMSAVRTGISTLGCFDKKADTVTVDNCKEIGIRLVAQMSTIVAAIGRIRKGLEPIVPNPRLDHSANFLYMLTGKEPDNFATKAIDIINILTATHEVNCGTFASMVVISSLSDIYSAVTAGVGAYKGPLHSGAMEEAVSMFLDVGSPDNAQQWVKDRLAKKQKIMGFGHRVYKVYDPRATIYQKYAKEACERAGKADIFVTAKRVEEVAINELGAKGLYPNADYYKPLIEYSLGIDPPMFSAISCVGRIVGWVAHVVEYLGVNRIFRPRAIYLGPTDLKYVPIERR